MSGTVQVILEFMNNELPSPEELAALVGAPPSGDEETVARKMFREGLVPATQTLIALATYGKSEKTRLDAAKYIVERNIGRITDKLQLDDAWSNLLADITTEVASEEGD